MLFSKYFQLGVNNSSQAEPQLPTRSRHHYYSEQDEDRPQTSHTYSQPSRPHFTFHDQPSTLRNKRSMPSLRLPVSRFSVDSDSVQSTQSISSTGRRSPSLHSRRSVTSMKQLMPLRLQSSPPMPTVTSWLDDTLSHPPTPLVGFDFGLDTHIQEHESSQNEVPWMHSTQEEQLLNHLHPGKYRETPIYSEPGSPVLARAYFTEEDLSYDCPSSGANYGEQRIINSYESDGVASDSQGSFAEGGEMFDVDAAENEGSIETSPTSYTSSRISDFSALSIQCKGEFPEESDWFRDRIRETFHTALENHEEIEDPVEEKWIESDSSRCSSPESFDEVYDALATPLAPAKPLVIEVATTDVSEMPRTMSLPAFMSRPATPFSPDPRRTTDFGNASLMDSFEDAPPISCDSPSIVPLPLFATQPFLRPPLPSRDSFARRIQRQRSAIRRSEEARQRTTIVNGIHHATSGFPRDMLFLDNPCVQEIRRISQRSNPTLKEGDISHSAGRKRDSIKDHSQGQNAHTPQRLRRKTKSISLHHGKRSDPEISMFSEAAAPQEMADESFAVGLDQEIQVIPADLKALKSVFPDTDDWWRGALYAHLVAYNYIFDLRTTTQTKARSVPFKAARNLGISADATIMISDLEENTEETLTELLDALAGCISRLTKCMAGNSMPLQVSDSPSLSKKVDHTIVRALAEVVRTSELKMRQIPP